MELRRRDFTRVAGYWLASLVTRPLWAQTERHEERLPAPRVVLTWGTNGRGDGQFDIPISIVINRKDEILVADFRQTTVEAKGRLQRFDPNGRFLGAFEVEPMPGGLALDKEGLLYATHMMRHKVAVYEEEGKLVREFGKQGTAPGEFDQPGGIAFGPDGSVYVADQVNRRVQRLSPQGEPISSRGNSVSSRANSVETRLPEGVSVARTFWPSTAKGTSTARRVPLAECKSSRATEPFCSLGVITKWGPGTLAATRGCQVRSQLPSTPRIKCG